MGMRRSRDGSRKKQALLAWLDLVFAKFGKPVSCDFDEQQEPDKFKMEFINLETKHRCNYYVMTRFQPFCLTPFGKTWFDRWNGFFECASLQCLEWFCTALIRFFSAGNNLTFYSNDTNVTWSSLDKVDAKSLEEAYVKGDLLVVAEEDVAT